MVIFKSKDAARQAISKIENAITGENLKVEDYVPLVGATQSRYYVIAMYSQGNKFCGYY